ncbi:hypothetical protein RCL1_005707 [Eukaryota sp. TZLM3-RCL]
MTQLQSDRFRNNDYYEALGVQPTATSKEIRAAYLKLALELHPDKNPTRTEEATSEFQDLGRIYACLSNDESRSHYDLTKEHSETVDWEFMSDEQKRDYVVNMFTKASFDDRDISLHIEHEVKERDSSADGLSEFERQQVLLYYNKHKGKWSLISQCVPGETKEDLLRYKKFIINRINAREVQDYGTTSLEQSSRKRKVGSGSKSKRK